MFFTVDDKKLIKERSKHIPNVYVDEVTKIIEGVINRTAVYIPQTKYKPITSEDYD